MSAPRHLLLTVPGLRGFEYGMLRDFESEIVRLTGASVVPIPDWPAPAAVRGRLAHGTRFQHLRRIAPRRGELNVAADVVWLVLMGAENSWLDLFRRWETQAGYRIVYVIDTYPAQLTALRRLASATRWDLMITSFKGAVPWLTTETNREWIAVPQGVRLERFAPVPLEERVIGVSSYGRRVAQVHDAIDSWSREAGVYYDATVAGSINATVTADYLYRQYAFHLRHSVFNVSWPVELTNPSRAGQLKPVTCRWFEAAAAGTVMVGRPPSDPLFVELFGEDAVLPLDPAPRSPGETREAMTELWANRAAHLAAAEARRTARAPLWTWEARVREILARAGLPCAVPPA